MKTAITALLNIQYPIILTGMSWISTPELVAAVGNAGGLGILALGPLTAEQTKAAILRVRELTHKPFGVNCALMMPSAKENAQIALDLHVPVINFSLGKGDWLIKACHAYAVMVTGHEAAAHGGEVTSLVLVPAIVDVLDIPVIACGGFADQRGVLAAFALGAEAVAMGSRFATVAESPLHQQIKQQVIAKDQHDTIYSPNFDGLPARYMKTPTAQKLTHKPMNFVITVWQAFFAAIELKVPIWKVLAGLVLEPQKIRLLANFGAATPRLKAATEQGDLERGMQFIGQSQGLIHDVCTADEMMQRLVTDIEQSWQQVQCKIS